MSETVEEMRVFIAVNKELGNRISKFYSRRGDATRFCNVWRRNPETGKSEWMKNPNWEVKEYKLVEVIDEDQGTEGQ